MDFVNSQVQSSFKSVIDKLVDIHKSSKSDTDFKYQCQDVVRTFLNNVHMAQSLMFSSMISSIRLDTLSNTAPIVVDDPLTVPATLNRGSGMQRYQGDSNSSMQTVSADSVINPELVSNSIGLNMCDSMPVSNPGLASNLLVNQRIISSSSGTENNPAAATLFRPRVLASRNSPPSPVYAGSFSATNMSAASSSRISGPIDKWLERSSNRADMDNYYEPDYENDFDLDEFTEMSRIHNKHHNINNMSQSPTYIDSDIERLYMESPDFSGSPPGYSKNSQVEPHIESITQNLETRLAMDVEQCCARIGKKEILVETQDSEFLDNYPGGTYQDINGFVYGLPCLRTIPISNFNAGTIFCTDHNTGSYEDIRNPPKELSSQKKINFWDYD